MSTKEEITEAALNITRRNGFSKEKTEYKINDIRDRFGLKEVMKKKAGKLSCG